MTDGDHRNYNITQEQYERVVKEEFVGMLREQYGDDVLEEGFWDKLKGGGKKIAQSYINVFKAYAEVVEDLLGLSPDDPKVDQLGGEEVPEPEELAQDLASGDNEAAVDAMDDMEGTLAAIKDKAAGDPAATKKVDGVLAQLQQQGAAVEKQVGAGGGAGGSPTDDTPALLDLIDGVSDEWDGIQGKTKDKNLKKAMDYIEKVALAEFRMRRGVEKLKLLREKRNNG